mmetsp:Transcript_120337/g.285943  ORF Transcript_120337/g.285943 Transcript_120337/m.285943 type:complete len:235 (-) Transcript_120337:407-1111(-)
MKKIAKVYEGWTAEFLSHGKVDGVTQVLDILAGQTFIVRAGRILDGAFIKLPKPGFREVHVAAEAASALQIECCIQVHICDNEGYLQLVLTYSCRAPSNLRDIEADILIWLPLSIRDDHQFGHAAVHGFLPGEVVNVVVLVDGHEKTFRTTLSFSPHLWLLCWEENQIEAVCLGLSSRAIGLSHESSCRTTRASLPIPVKDALPCAVALSNPSKVRGDDQVPSIVVITDEDLHL